MAEVAGSVAEGVLDTPSQEARPRTVDDLMRVYREYKEANPRLRTSSRQFIAQRARALSVHLGRLSLASLTRGTVEAFIRRRIEAGRAPETVHDDVRVLGDALRMAAAKGWWAGDPADLCAGFGLQGQGRRRWLRASQVGPFLAAIENPDVLMLARIILGTGLRLDEVLNLRWRDWQVDDGVMLVRSHAETGWRPKDSDDRIVPVNDELARHLAEHRRRLEDEADLRMRKRLFFVKPGPGTPILPNRDGTRRGSKTFFTRRIGEAARKCGLEGLSSHECRHTFATLWLQNGGSLFDLSKILGHYSPEFTARQYAHVCSKHLLDAANQVQARIREVSSVQGASKFGPIRGVTQPVTCDPLSISGAA